MLLFHAEMQKSIRIVPPNHRTYSTFLHSRPEAFEITAIELIARLQELYPTVPMHIVHLSAASALPLIRKIRARGLPLTVETCFHYRKSPLLLPGLNDTFISAKK